MSLEEKIRDQLVADTESILEEHLGKVDSLFTLHQDGAIDLSPEVRELNAKVQILLYLIAQRYAYEGELSESAEMETGFFYDRFEQEETTIRGYQKDLRDKGLIRKTSQSTHEVTVENLPRSLELIQNKLD